MKVLVTHHSLPCVGELANGDRAVARTDDGGRALFGVIDGLGHGPHAEAVSLTALRVLEEVALDLPLLDIMENLHQSLAGSRGAAATVCRIQSDLLEACAVGNVDLRSADVRFPLVFSAGILGSNVRKFRLCSAPLVGPARFIVFSDGISSRVDTEEIRQLTPEDACHFIMGKHRRDRDDATILVADVE
jgi:hypothetical protein